jgi:hypothetical protein
MCPTRNSQHFLSMAAFGQNGAMIRTRMVPIFPRSGMGARYMGSIFILIALSALSGFVLGIGYFSWPALLVAGAVLAPLSTVVLQNQSFSALSGICVVVACLTINQAAYMVGRIRANGYPEDGLENLSQQRADGEPHDNCNDHICRQHEQQNTPLHISQLANQR